MTFQLTKDQIAQRTALLARMQAAHDELTGAVVNYNQELAALRDFCNEISEENRSAFDEKTERWQEGDKGQEIDEWIQQWENLDLPDDLDEPDESCFSAVEEIDDRRPMRAKRTRAAKSEPAPAPTAIEIITLDTSANVVQIATVPIDPELRDHASRNRNGIKAASVDDARDSIATIVATFPATFTLRAFPDGTFRVSPTASYRGDNGEAWIYTQRRNGNGTWSDWAKGTAEELRREIVTERPARTFASLPRRGSDNPTCPSCGHHNAILPSPHGGGTCRDCGLEVAS
jgi:hypothetical protein